MSNEVKLAVNKFYSSAHPHKKRYFTVLTFYDCSLIYHCFILPLLSSSKNKIDKYRFKIDRQPFLIGGTY